MAGEGASPQRVLSQRSFQRSAVAHASGPSAPNGTAWNPSAFIFGVGAGGIDAAICRQFESAACKSAHSPVVVERFAAYTKLRRA